MVSYRVMLDVPRDVILFVSGLLAAHRREIGTRKGTRRLGCYRQALFGLIISSLGTGFGLCGVGAVADGEGVRPFSRRTWRQSAGKRARTSKVASEASRGG